MSDANTDRDGDSTDSYETDGGDIVDRPDMLRKLEVESAVTELGARVLIVPDMAGDFGIDNSSASCKWHTWISELPPDSFVTNGTAPLHGEVKLPDEVRTVVQSCDEVHFTLVIEKNDRPTERHQFYFEPHGHDLLYEEMEEIDEQRVTIMHLPYKSLKFHKPGHDRKFLKADSKGVMHLPPGCYQVNSRGLYVEMIILPRGECFPIPRIDMPPLGPAQDQQPQPSSGTSRKRVRSPVGLISSSAEQPLPQRRRGNESADVSNEMVDRVLLVDIPLNRTMKVPRSGHSLSYRLTKHRQLYGNSVTKVIVATKNEEETQYVVKFTKFDGGILTLDNWLHEYSIHSELKHPSIVELLGADARYLALNLEFIDGKDLAHMSDNRRKYKGISHDDDRKILEGIAGAILYLHDKGIVHNDIKASNIILSPSRGAILCDFSNATRTSEQTLRAATSGYNPPEYAEGEKGPPGDIWALGVTWLYVTGHIGVPELAADFPTANPSDCKVAEAAIWLNRIETLVALLDPKLPLHKLIISMLDPDPDTRITAKELVRQLEA